MAGWITLIATWALLALWAHAWAAATIAAKVVGSHAQPCSIEFFIHILDGSAHRDWPHTPTAAVVITAILLAAVVATLAGFLWRMATRGLPTTGDPEAALARDSRARPLTRPPAARAATGLRPPAAASALRSVPPAQAGSYPGPVAPDRSNARRRGRAGRCATPVSRDAIHLGQDPLCRVRGRRW